jgi:hypothetical protein
MPIMKRSTGLLIAGALVALAIIAGTWSYLGPPPRALPERLTSIPPPTFVIEPSARRAPPEASGVDDAPASPRVSRPAVVAAKTQAPSGAPRASAQSASTSAPRREAPASEVANDQPGGYVAPVSEAILRARAAYGVVIEEEQPPEAKEAATLAAQQFTEGATARAAADATALDRLADALRSTSSAEDKADLLALLSDASERTGARIRQLIMDGLRPGQPLEVQRQALYLATRYNIGIVKALASRAGHPLQQDAESFLVEHDREVGVHPEPVDEPDPLPRQP